MKLCLGMSSPAVLREARCAAASDTTTAPETTQVPLRFVPPPSAPRTEHPNKNPATNLANAPPCQAEEGSPVPSPPAWHTGPRDPPGRPHASRGCRRRERQPYTRRKLVSRLEDVCLMLHCHFQTSLSSFNLAEELNTHFN